MLINFTLPLSRMYRTSQSSVSVPFSCLFYSLFFQDFDIRIYFFGPCSVTRLNRMKRILVTSLERIITVFDTAILIIGGTLKTETKIADLLAICKCVHQEIRAEMEPKLLYSNSGVLTS